MLSKVGPEAARLFLDKINGQGCAFATVAAHCHNGPGSEMANVWLESILRADPGGAVSDGTMRSFALQDKSKLHDTLVRLGLGGFSPTVLNFNFDIILGHLKFLADFSALQYTTPHAPCDMLYLLPVLVRC